MGGRKYTSSADMHRHLNKAGAHLWTDTIFWVLAMFLDDSRMVFDVEQYVPAVGATSLREARSVNTPGTVDYAAFMVVPQKYGASLLCPITFS